jgi:hypothetical protein
VPEGLVYQRLRGLDRDEPAAADDPDPVAHPLDLGEVVRGEEHGASLGLYLLDDVEELLLHERVEPARRLVEDQQRRPVEHRLDEPDLLLVPPREPPHGTVQLGTEPLGELVRVPEILDPPQPGEEPEQPLPRHLVLQRKLPWQVPDPRPDLDALFPDVETEDLPAPARRAQKPKKRPYRRGLSGPVGPEEAKNLALLDREVNPLYAPRLASVRFG